MRKTLYVYILIALPLSAGADNWLCIGDEAVGFHQENGTWKRAEFKPDKWLIKPQAEVFKEAGLGEYEIFQFDSVSESFYCDDFSDDLLVCRGNSNPNDTPINTFRYDQASGRYLMTSTYGYLEEARLDKTHPYYELMVGAPNIEIGKCSKL